MVFIGACIKRWVLQEESIPPNDVLNVMVGFKEYTLLAYVTYGIDVYENHTGKFVYRLYY